MNKAKFEGFLNRYSLGGKIESVMIRVSDGSVATEMISDDKTLLGNVTMVEDSLPNGAYGVYTTSQLKSLLSVLDNNMNVASSDGSIQFSDEVSKMQYMLAQESVIPAVPELKKLPDFNVSVSLDDEFVNRFIKSSGALSEADTFVFMSKGGVHEIVLGYSTINSNRISIKVDATVDGDVEPISFSADYLRSILQVNKGSTKSSLKIATGGLCIASFSGGDYTSEYYLVEIKS